MIGEEESARVQAATPPGQVPPQKPQDLQWRRQEVDIALKNTETDRVWTEKMMGLVALFPDGTPTGLTIVRCYADRHRYTIISSQSGEMIPIHQTSADNVILAKIWLCYVLPLANWRRGKPWITRAEVARGNQAIFEAYKRAKTEFDYQMENGYIDWVVERKAL